MNEIIIIKIDVFIDINLIYVHVVYIKLNTQYTTIPPSTTHILNIKYNHYYI